MHPSFQLISDLQLDNASDLFETLVPAAPVLAIVGNVCRPCESSAQLAVFRDFLGLCADAWSHVILVAGNQEYFSRRDQRRNVTQITLVIEEVCAEFANVHFLNRGSVTFDGVTYLGTTLWSAVDVSKRYLIQGAIQDYARIFSGPRCVRRKVSETYILHSEARCWLRQRIRSAGPHAAIVVLSHHAPTLFQTSEPELKESALQSSFASNVESLFGSPVCVWAFGHTGWNTDFHLKGTRVVSNQAVCRSKDFSPCKIIEVRRPTAP